MKKVAWCQCGCNRRLRQTLIPPRAAALMNRRRVAEIRERQAARDAALRVAMEQTRQLMFGEAGGNA